MPFDFRMYEHCQLGIFCPLSRLLRLSKKDPLPFKFNVNAWLCNLPLVTPNQTDFLHPIASWAGAKQSIDLGSLSYLTWASSDASQVGKAPRNNLRMPAEWWWFSKQFSGLIEAWETNFGFSCLHFPALANCCSWWIERLQNHQQCLGLVGCSLKIACKYLFSEPFSS